MATTTLFASSKSQQNQALTDPWTFVHFGSGLALGLINTNTWLALGGAIAYEVVEQAAERAKWAQKLFQVSGPETFGNAVVDVVVFALGHWIGRTWNQT